MIYFICVSLLWVAIALTFGDWNNDDDSCK